MPSESIQPFQRISFKSEDNEPLKLNMVSTKGSYVVCVSLPLCVHRMAVYNAVVSNDVLHNSTRYHAFKYASKPQVVC